MGMQERIEVSVDAEICDLIPAFLANRRKDLDAIKAALEQADFETIRLIGENMQGSGRGYGFERISVLGEQLQKKAAAEQVAEIRRLLREFADYLSRIDVATGAAAAQGGARERIEAAAGDSEPYILLVEDDELSRLFVTRYLRDKGYVVRHVPDGAQALAALELTPLPAVVL